MFRLIVCVMLHSLALLQPIPSFIELKVKPSLPYAFFPVGRRRKNKHDMKKHNRTSMIVFVMPWMKKIAEICIKTYRKKNTCDLHWSWLQWLWIKALWQSDWIQIFRSKFGMWSVKSRLAIQASHVYPERGLQSLHPGSRISNVGIQVLDTSSKHWSWSESHFTSRSHWLSILSLFSFQIDNIGHPDKCQNTSYSIFILYPSNHAPELLISAIICTFLSISKCAIETIFNWKLSEKKWRGEGM